MLCNQVQSQYLKFPINQDLRITGLLPRDPLSIRNCKHVRELVNDEEDTYSNLNGGRASSGQVDMPRPSTEPETTTC